MTAAIFGLIGVLVGGTLNGLVAWLLDGNRETRAARAAARQVMGELDDARIVFAAAERTGTWGLLSKGNLSTRDWAQYRPILASRLAYDEWHEVAEAFKWIDNLQSYAAEAGFSVMERLRSESDFDDIQGTTSQIIKAIDVLERTSGAPPDRPREQPAS